MPTMQTLFLSVLVANNTIARLFAIGFACALFVASPAFAVPGGELDATFGDYRRATIPLANSSLAVSVAKDACRDGTGQEGSSQLATGEKQCVS